MQKPCMHYQSTNYRHSLIWTQYSNFNFPNCKYQTKVHVVLSHGLFWTGL